MLSGRIFVGCCALLATGILLIVQVTPVWLLAAEVLATILALFLLGSFKYQGHKNALTYAMLLVIVATACELSTSEWHQAILQNGWCHSAPVNLLYLHYLA